MPPGIKYTFQFEGLQKGASDLLFADSAARQLGTTLSKIQGARGNIPGLATAVPGVGGPSAGPGYIIQSPAFMQMGARALMRMGSIVPAGPPAQTIQAFINQSLGVGAGQMRFTGQSRASYANFWQTSVPPVIPPRAGVNWAMAGMGAAVAPFSPWLGARALSGAFGGALGGGGGGRLGGVSSAIFGPGGFPLFIAAFTAIRLTTEALRVAFQGFIQEIQRGARLFQSAARIGRTPGMTAGIEGAMGAIGLSSSAFEQMMIKGEYPGKGGRSLTLSGQMLSAWKGVLPTGQLQQIQNLAPYIDEFQRSMGGMAKIMGENSKAAFDLEFTWKEFMFSFQTALSEIVKDVGPALIQILRAITDAVKGFVYVLHALSEPIFEFLARLGITSGMPSLGQFKGGNLGGGQDHGHLSSWQKMGFVMGGESQAVQYAKETAHNTGEIVRIFNGFAAAGFHLGGQQPLRVGGNLP